MIKDLIVSFKDNIKQKTTNPFLGTLILVWIFHNYQNIFKLLFSGDNLDFNGKLDCLNLIFSPRIFILNLLQCILISIAVLIITYFLLNISRLIINFYEKIITPWIFKLTDKNSIVLKSDFDNLSTEKDKIQQRFESEREKRIRLESEIEQLENKIKNLMQSEKNTINGLDKEINENDKLVKLLENKGYIEIFESLIFSINNNDWVTEEDAHKFFITIGLIEGIKRDERERIFKFTERGQQFQEYYRKKYLFTSTDNE